MLLAKSNLIPQIDSYAASVLGIPTIELMQRAARALEREVRAEIKAGSRIVILAGKGNNGGDGYALATLLCKDYQVRVVDVFSSGQRSEAGKYYLERYLAFGGELYKDEEITDLNDFEAELIVDAIFGTGFCGDIPRKLKKYSDFLRSSRCKKLAADVPLGVNSDTGTVDESFSYSADVTVCLSYAKVGLLSYPAKSCVGRLVVDNLNLPNDIIEQEFDFDSFALDKELVKTLLPKRADDSNKGSFGKLLLITGSDEYRGAAHLSLEAALRLGAGLVHFSAEASLSEELRLKYPEVIYKVNGRETQEDIDEILSLGHRMSSILIGSGTGKSKWLYTLILTLLHSEGCPLILDADAINLLSEHREESLSVLKNSGRRVILTPHPLEFARLLNDKVERVQSDRLTLAKSFAKEYNCILVLKGAATVVTDGVKIYINTTGSSALAKGGSGDVLAGAIASMTAFCDPLLSSAVCVYLHGAAADSLSEELSEFSVIPSDLPREIGRQIAYLIK